MHKQALVISVDGNIGAGKSTLLSTLQTKEQGVYIITEPVEKWTSMLTLASKDPFKYGYRLQKLVLEHYNDVQQHLAKLKKNNKVIIIERSALTALLVFSQYYLQHGMLTKAQYNELVKQTNTLRISYNVRILVNTAPEECLKRVKLRNRGFEIKHLTLDYLRGLDKNHKQMYDEALAGEKVFVVDGNQTKEKIFSDTLSLLNAMK